MEKEPNDGLLDFASVDNILRLALTPPGTPEPEQQQDQQLDPFAAPSFTPLVPMQPMQPHRPVPYANANYGGGESIVGDLSALTNQLGGRVTSTQRSREHNAKVGGVANSQHVSGTAVDAVIPPHLKAAYIAKGRAMGYEMIDEGDHIHAELPPKRIGYSQPRPSAPLQPLHPADLGKFIQAVGFVETRGEKNPYIAKNPNSTASGKYQWLNSTWGNYGGYPEARLAPREVQEARFREDAITKLRKFNGDPFKMVADHMLPAQANKPWLWEYPSTQVVRNKQGKKVVVHIPPVADYVRKAVSQSPWAGQFDQYMQAYRRQR